MTAMPLPPDGGGRVLLREVIEIPEQVHAGDFVLKLTEGVDRVEETLREYVVTDDLARAFDSALSLVETAVTSGRSQAAFLHGSFGSGKSHFMAVLYLLLGGDPRARGIRELAEPIARHDAVLQGRRFLRLAYHLIGAESLEQALFGGYVEQVRRLHPEAPLPPLHRSERLLEDAERLRRRMGDAAFFEALSGGGATGPWSAFVGSWSPERYARAAAAPPEDPERVRLTDALVRAFFSSFAESTSWVEVDTGLRVMAEHARGLGYDAVVLFLDELVLWLASHLAHRDFVTNEGAKVAKLVESADARRPIPLVSFIARQRDLRDFLGEAVPGAQQAAISDTFRWWEDRFDRVTLGDDNLPYIAQRRLLQPRDERARRLLEAAFDRLDRRPEVWNTLLDGFNTDPRHRGADEEAFRRTYPFSPALVSTLRAVSSLMQRERTALKVMQHILVDQRDRLAIDDLVPVGDVFDYVVEGQQALDPSIERHFAAARQLYRRRIRPALLDLHRLGEEEAARQSAHSAFRADDRLVKTLLLSALVPEVPALRELTAERLAHLNHGTIASPIPHQEATTVLATLRRLQAQVPEIETTGDPGNPTIRVRLAEVDYQSVLDRVNHVDNTGARRLLLKELVWGSLGIRHEPSLLGIQQHSLVWRGSRRAVEVAFGNVRDARDLPDDVLLHEGPNWRIVIDYPFDEDGRPRVDDRARIERLQGTGAAVRTLVWLPRFFTPPRQEDLGRLVRLEYLFAGGGERFDANADHLSATDRAQARAILQTLRTTLRERLLGVVQQAYGAAAPLVEDVEIDSEPAVLHSLDDAFRPQEPVGATLRDAFHDLVDQMLSQSYPAHPRFEPSDQLLRTADLRRVHGYVVRAHQEPNGRVPVADHNDRNLLRRVCDPLELGALHENVYVLDPGSNFPWRNRFAQQMGREGVAGPVTVGRLRAWTNADAVRGLDPEVADLVIAAWAVVTDRAWYQHGVAIPPPQIGEIRPDTELREQQLPDREAWQRAVERAGSLFGRSPNPYLTAGNLAALGKEVREAARERLEPARRLLHHLELGEPARWLGLDPAQVSGRLATARAAVHLVDRLISARDDLTLVSILASAQLPAEDRVVARSLAQAEAVSEALAGVRWEVLDAIASVGDDRSAEARRILGDLRAAGRVDEFQRGLAEALREAETAAVRLAARRPEPVPTPPPTPATEQTLTVDPGEVGLAIEALRRFAAEHPGARIRVSWRVEP